MAEFISLYSGSSGNCSVVRSGGAYLLVDMGKGVRVTTGALREAGLDASDCRGILVTHEHSDHVKGLGTFLKRHPLPVYGAGPTLAALEAAGLLPAACPVCLLDPDRGEGGVVAGAGVRASPPGHAVPCVDVPISTPVGKTMAIATDLGTLTPAVHAALDGCDLVALESNYDPYMLHNGPYPYYLRARIEGPRGHLSNDECSEKLLELVQGGCEKFALCHLSQENNTPPLALQTVFATFGAGGVVPGRDCIVQTQRRSEVSPTLEF